jgi:hypothetical protein
MSIQFFAPRHFVANPDRFHNGNDRQHRCVLAEAETKRVVQYQVIAGSDQALPLCVEDVDDFLDFISEAECTTTARPMAFDNRIVKERSTFHATSPFQTNWRFSPKHLGD